jgi:hypothetical protein
MGPGCCAAGKWIVGHNGTRNDRYTASPTTPTMVFEPREEVARWRHAEGHRELRADHWAPLKETARKRLPLGCWCQAHRMALLAA